jgi:hypothetical protein
MGYFIVLLLISICFSQSHGAACAEDFYAKTSIQRGPEAYWPIYDAFEQLSNHLVSEQERVERRKEILERSNLSRSKKEEFTNLNQVALENREDIFGKVEKAINRFLKVDEEPISAINRLLQNLMGIRMSLLGGAFSWFRLDKLPVPTDEYLFRKIYDFGREDGWKRPCCISGDGVHG